MDKSERHPTVTALICTLNEETNLPHVLPKIPEWIEDILIIDGHSTDKTVKVIKEFCPQARVMYQPGRGKGDAIAFGVREAKGDIIVTLDADGETPPEEISNFIEPLKNGYDMTKGSRLNGKRPPRMPRYRWFGNKVLAITCNILYRTRFHDVCSGYNAYWKDKFLKLGLSYGLKELGCSMEQQMVVRAKKAGMKIKEVPHTSHGRISGVSAIAGVKEAVKQGFRDWFLIIRERFSG